MSKENLLDFDWDSSEEFFSISEPVETKTPTETEIEEEKEEDIETPEEVGEETTDEFFSLDEEEDTPPSTNSETTDFWEDVYKDFKDQGFLKHVEIEEGEKLSAERLFELQQEDNEVEISSRIASWANELDDDAKAFIKFKTNGGSTQDFFKTYSSTSEVPTGDIKEESYQDAIIRYQLKQEGWDREEIEDRLSYLTDSKKKETVARRYDKKIQDSEKARKEALTQSQEDKRQASIQAEKDFKANIKNALDETEEVNGFKFTDKDKTNLLSFLTKKSHKIDEQRSITGFQKKLGEIFQDTNKMLLLAKLVDSDFDMSSFEKKVITKKTREVKSNIEQRRNLRPTKTGSSSGSSLADLF